jgi:hypothetical protein
VNDNNEKVVISELGDEDTLDDIGFKLGEYERQQLHYMFKVFNL